MVAMTSPLQHAAEGPFCESQLLHFCQLLSNPSINLELEYIFGKPMKRRFQRCIVRTQILSTFHAQVKYISVIKYAIEAIGPIGANDHKTTPSTDARGPHLIHECLSRPHSPPKFPTTAQLLHALPHNYATKSPLVTMERPNFTSKTVPSLSTITTPSNTPIHRPTPLTTPNDIRIQSAVLPQYTLRNDRPTDRWSMRMFHNMSAALAMLNADSSSSSSILLTKWQNALLCNALITQTKHKHTQTKHRTYTNTATFLILAANSVST